VPESDGPWTNGDVCNPTALGREVINKFGPDPNYYSLTIETEGYQTDANPFGWKAWPKPQAQLDSIVWQVLEWIEGYDIVYFLRHADLNMCTRSKCPQDVFYDYIKGRISGVYVPIHAEEYARPIPLEGFDGTQDMTINGVLCHGDIRDVTGIEGTNVRLWASTASALTRGPLKADEGFKVLGWLNGEEVEGEDRWWITASYSRVWVGGTVEKPEGEGDRSMPDNIDLEGQDGVKIIDGVRLFPVPNNEISITVAQSGALYEKASLKSKKLYDVNVGDVFKAVNWIRGDKDSLWWILDAHDGPRLSCDLTEVKPI
jgi:hypothetical protein